MDTVASFPERFSELIDGMTFTQVGEEIGVSKQTVSAYANGKRNPKKPVLRAIADHFGVDPAWLLGYDVPKYKKQSFDNIIPMPKTYDVPLIGNIACGQPILAVEDASETVPVPAWVHADFALRCKGDSMINARIFDGDVVYIRRQPQVENGEIAAVRVGDEATLKRVRLFDDHIALEPENPMYKPLVYWGEEMNQVQILGKAIGFTSMVL